ncbi:MAG: hypothetical protein LBP33_10325 [Candidatus Adiutrix sp.]|jgi:hypothetical protein|nr:hypothetical protein [Candidatus Adiutrix sp.]
MIVETDGYRFDFKDALEAFVFDETDKRRLNYHGMTMLKAVDMVVELRDRYLFVEIKDYADAAQFEYSPADDEPATADAPVRLKWLKNYLKEKYRDTFLYRYAEDKVDKPVMYLCLLNFDSALSGHLSKILRYELPVGRAGCPRWKRELATACHVVDLKKWNERFPWPAVRLS